MRERKSENVPCEGSRLTKKRLRGFRTAPGAGGRGRARAPCEGQSIFTVSPAHPPSMQPARRGDHLMSSLDPNFETAAQQCLLRAGTKVHAGRVGQQNFTLGPSLTHQLRRVPS